MHKFVNISISPRKLLMNSTNKKTHSSNKPAEGKIPLRVLDKIKRKNQADIKLYEHAVQRFWKDREPQHLSLIELGQVKTWQTIVSGDLEGEEVDPTVFASLT
eukprot:gnl/TRDRNA2_/TRDRNA2_175794_c7_seq19.p1 gnl/TRDRNA2_/TRDRNA2_175794_c7~~gnl/TRDRNA2_/TRDRNA2_175794_c7_seq19.p1  ORF type:complete len:103 (+),score=15.19 gnl/TRDRNA2_/TRDRNA2_175794_c7_seq19:2-310(+)